MIYSAVQTLIDYALKGCYCVFLVVKLFFVYDTGFV